MSDEVEPATRTVFACTYVEKNVEQDDFENGCLPKTYRTLLCRQCNITAGSLVELLGVLADNFCLDVVGEGYMIEVGDDDHEIQVGYSASETGEGNTPSAAEFASWKEGKFKLWLADYRFVIEVRQVRPLVDSDVPAGLLRDER